MTKEQEIIEKLKESKKIDFNTLVRTFKKEGIENFAVIRNEYLETVLNMLKEKDAEIEKYKKLLADNLAKELNNSIKAKEKADTDLDDLDKGWKVELEKKDKMIDLMAEYISDLDIDEDICKKQSDNNCDDINREVECKECIKQYFERKLEYGR